MIAGVGPLPKHIWEPVIKKDGLEAVNSFYGVDTDVKKIVGSGPFTIAEYVPSQKVVLKRNPYYYRKDVKESPRREWEKAVDAAWDEANLTTDEEQRKRGFEKFQRIWIEKVPWVYFYNRATIHAYKTRFGNTKPQPVSDYSFMGTLPYMFVKD